MEGSLSVVVFLVVLGNLLFFACDKGLWGPRRSDWAVDDLYFDGMCTVVGCNTRDQLADKLGYKGFLLGGRL